LATVRALADALDLSPADRAMLEAVVSRARLTAPARETAELTLPLSSRVPTPLDQLVDRDREMRDVLTLLRRPDVRLLTLTGPGGVGKTRLAIEVANRLADESRDDIAVVPLDSVRDTELVLPAIGRALGLPWNDGEAPRDALLSRLEIRPLLLLLDTCEHLPDAGTLVVSLLEQATRLRVLATSRAPLRVRGEHRYPVGPLPTPDLRSLGGQALAFGQATLAELTQVPAVALLVHRSSEATPGFALTNRTAQAVCEMAARLDGLPLAIELAAQRAASLSEQGLLDWLARDPVRAVGRLRDLPARQQTLRDAFAWSYDLVEPDQQRVLRALSVFPGSFTVDIAALVVPRPDQASAPPLVEQLVDLVEAGLLLATPGLDGEGSFRIPGPYRPYALEEAVSHGESENLEERLFDAAFALAERDREDELGPRPWPVRRAAEQSSFEAAIRWAIEHGRAEQGGDLIWRLWSWLRRAGAGIGREWTRWLLDEAPGLTPVTRARVLLVAGALGVEEGDPASARALLAESVAICRVAAAPELARALAWLALATLEAGFGADRALLDESRAISRRLADPSASGAALLFLGRALDASGEVAQAEACLREGATLLEALGDWDMAALGLLWLGALRLEQGDTESAELLLRRSMAIGRDTGVGGLVGRVLALLGSSARRSGDPDRAARHLVVGLSLARLERDESTAALCLAELAELAEQQHQADRAARLATAGAALQARARPSIYDRPGSRRPSTRRSSEGDTSDVVRTIREAIDWVIGVPARPAGGNPDC
jgi:predicted ATPase